MLGFLSFFRFLITGKTIGTDCLPTPHIQLNTKLLHWISRPGVALSQYFAQMIDSQNNAICISRRRNGVEDSL